MTKTLIKRADGTAFYSEVIQLTPDHHLEGTTQLTPDDVVDGRRIADWPVGVHCISTLESRISDWTANTLEAENGKA